MLERLFRVPSIALTALLMIVPIVLLVSSAPPATAAGNGVLTVTIRPTDASDGSTIASIRDGEHGNKITYEVQYSCSGDDGCQGAEVQLSPSQADPAGLLAQGAAATADSRYLLIYDTWNAPATGGSIGGTNTTGKKVTLGDLAPGDAGAFTLTYRIDSTFATDIPASAFYPDGFAIEMAATMSSTTPASSVTADASDVTWGIGVAVGPLGRSYPPASMRPDEDINVPVTMTARNIAVPGSCLSGIATVSAAGSYRVVYHAPPEATIVSATQAGADDLVIDQANHTVTWTAGTPTSPVFGARGGWGLNQTSGWNCGNASRNGTATDSKAAWGQRRVVLNFDGTKFADADANGCNFAATVTGTFEGSVTYLDAARTTKTFTQDNGGNVACWDPFGGMRAEKTIQGVSQSSRADGGISNTPYQQSAVNVPGPGMPDRTGLFWRVSVSNRGNVPAVATITDDAISHDHIKVNRVVPSSPVTLTWTRDNGDGTTTSDTTSLAANASLTAPAGTWFTGVKAVTGPIAPGRIQTTDTGESWVNLDMHFTVDDGAVPKLGEQRLNTADVSMTYPGFGGAGEPVIYEPWTDLANRTALAQPLTATVEQAAQYTRVTPVLNAGFVGAPVVDGGGNPAPGTEVTYTMRGATTAVWPGTQIRPQLVFVAPVGWTIVPGSAEMAAGAPAGITFSPVATKTIGGQPRQVVVATWPTPITPDPQTTENWPTLSVKAVPGAGAPTGAGAAVAQVWAGDADREWHTITGPSYTTEYATGGGLFRSASATINAPDITGSGDLTQYFAISNAGGLTVATAPLLSAVKEICVPDDTAADGCAWSADPSVVAHVPVTATDVKYRIILRNGGNRPLTDVLAYDVLPHVGDTGLRPGAVARGSQLDLTLQTVDAASAGTQLAFSASTNPARPEVNDEATGTVDDWSATPAGKKALRITVDGTLQPGDEKSVTFTTKVAPGASADQRACNSVAVRSGQTPAAEPRRVCLALAEADLRIVLSDVSDLEAGASGTLAYEVTNLGGSAEAPGTATLAVPAGVTVTDLTVAGWACTVAGGGTAPVAGPASLACAPVDAEGETRPLSRGTVETIPLPITVAADATGTELCFPGSVTGPLFDPVLGNNTTTGCRRLVQPHSASLTLDKTGALHTDRNDNGKADPGDVVRYTFTVTNPGNTAVTDVSIADAKVATVTPAEADVPAAGSVTFTADYTVTEADVLAGEIVNVATAGGTGPDGEIESPEGTSRIVPAAPSPRLALVKSVAFTTDANGDGKAGAGDVLRYTFTVENTGNLTITGAAITDPMVTGITPATADLAPGETKVFTASYTVTQADVDGGGPLVNTASAAGTAPDGGTVTSPDSSTTTPTPARAPELAIEKSAALTSDHGTAGKADEGDVVAYTFEVTNTGNVTLTNVAVTDLLAGLSPTSPLQVATLAPGADTTFTATYVVTQADVDRGTPVHNSAVAKGKGPDGAGVTSAPDTTDTPVVAADPGLSIDKVAVLDDDDDNGAADEGETIAYTFTVENTGNVTLAGVKVADLLPGLTAVSPVSVATLVPGAEAVFTASYTVTQADVDGAVDDDTIDNSATATGTTPADEPVASEPDTTSTPLVEGAPGIVLDKKSALDDENGNGKADVGEEIAYTFEVRNTGNVTATDVSVTDPEVTGITPATATIAPGETAVFTADPYVVTQGDVDDGVVHNVAAASAKVPGGATVTSEDVDDVDTVEAHPDLAIVKSSELSVDAATQGKADVDDVITYTFTVTNSGLATAFDVAVTDALPGLSAVSPASVATIAPGADAEFTATYGVTRADVRRGGHIENTAAVTYRGPVRGGQQPAPVSEDSNTVTTPLGGLGGPAITTKASSAKVAMSVGRGGVPNAVRLHDMVTISGFVAGGDATGTATLYGPAAKRSAGMCTPGRKVASVSFVPRNGSFRTPAVSVSKPGYYTWVVSTSEDRRNDAATHACGLAAETTLVHRAEVGKVRIETGFTGRSVQGRQVRPTQVSIPAIGMTAPLDVVGVRKGSMVIPGNVRRGGWLMGSAAPGEAIGSTVIAGHVSDRHDRPGAFGKLRKARVGQVVTVRAADGTVQRYRITKVYTQKRTKGFTGAPVSTTGGHQLTLVTCTGKVSYRNGRFHYTRNQVVIATPIA